MIDSCFMDAHCILNFVWPNNYIKTMKCLSKIAFSLASGLMLNASAHANDVLSSNNPYSLIVTRDVFALKPPPPPEIEHPFSAPPPKITPNGTMSIFGQRQVLFKVTDVSQPGQPAQNAFYTLGEGESQDDIEVTHIDENASMVTFNNHGIMQEIALTDTSEDSAPVSNGWIMGRGNIGRRAFPHSRHGNQSPARRLFHPTSNPEYHRSGNANDLNGRSTRQHPVRTGLGCSLNVLQRLLGARKLGRHSSGTGPGRSRLA